MEHLSNGIATFPRFFKTLILYLKAILYCKNVKIFNGNTVKVAFLSTSVDAKALTYFYKLSKAKDKDPQNVSILAIFKKKYPQKCL